MVYGLIGESCTGKTSIAQAMGERIGARVIAGRDYLRLAKGEDAARAAFAALLEGAMAGREHVIYVVSEWDQLPLLPPNAVRAVITAPLERKRERFAKRMNGDLPAPVADMIERKHGMFDAIDCDIRIDTEGREAADVAERILAVRDSAM